MLGPDFVDISVDVSILQAAANIDSVEQQLQEDLIKQTVELQDFYEDDPQPAYSRRHQDSYCFSLGRKSMCGEVDIDSLTPEERGENASSRPGGSSDLDIPLHQLMTSMMLQDPSRHDLLPKATINTSMITSSSLFAATPVSTSLRTLLLHALQHQYQVTSYDIGEDIFVQPPPEVYQHRPGVVWKLHRALYGLRTSPKMWQEHLHAALQGMGLRQLKSDRCVWVKKDIIVLAYIEDLWITGASGETTSFLTQLRQAFSLKHAAVLTTQQHLRFLGKRIFRQWRHRFLS